MLLKGVEIMEKTNKGLVAYAREQLHKPYWYGTYGSEASEELYKKKRKQYPSQYLWAYAGETGVKVHDCIGLVKGYLWCKSPEDMKPKYNSAQDKSANGMRNLCTIKGDISTLPEVEGILVFFNGHVGVYEGNGYVLEARGHNYGVVRTKLKARPWKWWGYCPLITYLESDVKQEEKEYYKPTILEWQLAAIADGFVFHKYGADGEWGKECETIARKAIVKKRNSYKYPNLTKIAQKVVGVNVDGKCGQKTKEAIIAYQIANGLEADGECGLMTWQKMLT
jgi:peptidoglycan hydrolase-like protein with peptidoglycan-binding domain